MRLVNSLLPVLLLAVVGCAGLSVAPPEYLTLKIEGQRFEGMERIDLNLRQSLTDTLNKYAQEGWSCVSVAVYPTDSGPIAYVVLERPRRDHQQP